MTTDQPKVLVLDIDDTLFLERDFVRSGFLATESVIASQFGKQGFADECWALFLQGERHTIFDQLLDEFNIEKTPALIQSLIKAYREHTPTIELLPDAIKLLQAAHKTIPITAISDGPLKMQQNKVHALQLDRWIETILLTDLWGPEAEKPNRKCFLEIERIYGLSGRDCIYVGDNPGKDFVGPNELGWISVRIRRELGIYSLEEPEARGKPDIEITDLTQLLEIFNLNNSP